MTVTVTPVEWSSAEFRRATLKMARKDARAGRTRVFIRVQHPKALSDARRDNRCEILPGLDNRKLHTDAMHPEARVSVQLTAIQPYSRFTKATHGYCKKQHRSDSSHDCRTGHAGRLRGPYVRYRRNMGP